MTISRNLKFSIIKCISNRTLKHITHSMGTINPIYIKRGFNIKTALMEREFEPMRVGLTKIKIDLNTTSTSQHVTETERHILAMKERARECCHTLPLNHTSKVIIVSVLMNCELCIKTFPPKGGVSTSVSTCTILTGLQFDYNKYCQIKFGQYAQVHQ